MLHQQSKLQFWCTRLNTITQNFSLPVNASWVKECYSCEGNCTVNEQMTKIKCGKRGSTTGDEHFACYSMKLIKGRWKTKIT
jgi:hypothetical protein